MRVYSLVFLTSSSLLTRVGGVLEPASSNVTALYFPAAVRPLTNTDTDATATTSPARDGPPGADERGFPVSLFTNFGLIRKRNELQKLQDRVFVEKLDAALENKELEELYRHYEASGQSLIDHLVKRYEADNVADVLSTAVKTDVENPARFQKPATTVEKLAMDQLTGWRKDEKTLNDVATILKLGDIRDGTSTLEANLASRKIRAFINYSKLTVTENSEKAYLDVLMKRYGGEAQFLSLLRAAKKTYPHSIHVFEVEDDFLKMCALNSVAPSTAFDKVWPGLFKTEWFDKKMVDQMMKYVNDYNKHKPVARQTTAIAVLQQKLGGEKELVNFFVHMDLPSAVMAKMSSSERKKYEEWREKDIQNRHNVGFFHELFQRWYSKGVTLTENLQNRIGHLKPGVIFNIKRNYQEFYNAQPPK